MPSWVSVKSRRPEPTSLVQLSGTVQPGATFVVVGSTSNAANGNPVLDLAVNFTPDFQNSGTAGDGVALFNVPASAVTAATVPIDAVVYGPNNNNGLIDESGTANAPEVGDVQAERPWAGAQVTAHMLSLSRGDRRGYERLHLGYSRTPRPQ